MHTNERPLKSSLLSLWTAYIRYSKQFTNLISIISIIFVRVWLIIIILTDHQLSSHHTTWTSATINSTRFDFQNGTMSHHELIQISNTSKNYTKTMQKRTKWSTYEWVSYPSRFIAIKIIDTACVLRYKSILWSVTHALYDFPKASKKTCCTEGQFQLKRSFSYIQIHAQQTVCMEL